MNKYKKTSLEYKSTILLTKKTRELLSGIGRKNETYEDVIKNLLETKKQFDSMENAKSSDSMLGGQ